MCLTAESVTHSRATRVAYAIENRFQSQLCRAVAFPSRASFVAAQVKLKPGAWRLGG